MSDVARGKRNPNGLGTTYKRKDGRYEAAVSVGGKRLREYFRTRAEADAWRYRTVADRDGGVVLDSNNATLAKYLEVWLRDSVSISVSPKTYEGYESDVRLHIAPALGHVKLKDLKPVQVQRFYSEKARQGLSVRTQKGIHGTLSKALKQAVRWGEMPFNPADRDYVDAPKALPEEGHSEEIKALTNEEALRLFKATEGTRWRNLYIAAVRTGLRQGELLGLMWEDLNLNASPAALTLRRSLSERQGGGYYFTPTKRKASRRRLALLTEAADALRAQEALQAEERKRVGERWQENGLVFPSSRGTPQNRHNLYRRFAQDLKRAGLPDISFHDLRHTFATIMLFEWGVDAKTVQEMMGHASIKMTMDLYSHVLPNTQADAIRRLERLFNPSTAVRLPSEGGFA